MRRLGTLIVRHRIPAAIVLVVGVTLLGWRASMLEENLSFETLYLSDDDTIAFSDAFAEEFENVNDMVAVAVTGGDVFGRECLAAVNRVTTRLQKIPQVDVVYSLSSIRYIAATDDGLDVGEFMEELPESEAASRALKEKAMAYELFSGRLVSESGSYIAVVAQTEDIVGRPVDNHVASLVAQLGDADSQVRHSAAMALREDSARVREVLADDPATQALAEDLFGDDSARRNEAASALARLGASAVRANTVADRRTIIASIESIVEEELPAGFAHYITGTNVIERDYARILRRDEHVFHALVGIILVVSFYLCFRSVRDTAIGILTLLLAAACSLGAVQLLGSEIDIINSVLVIMILVVGTSDVIHMRHGFYRAWRQEDGARAGRNAAATMIGTVGFACLMTSLTTACGFFSLYFARIGTISRFGLNMAVAIMTTYVVSMLATAILFSLVRRVPPALLQSGRKPSLIDRALAFFARAVVDHRGWVIAGCLAAFVILALGFRNLYVETHAVAELDEDHPTKVNISAMENLAGFIGFEVSVRSTDDRLLIEPDLMEKTDRLVAYLREQPETLRAWAVTDYVKAMNRAAYDGDPARYTVPASAEASDQYLLLYTFSPEGLDEIDGLISQDRRWLRIVGRVRDVGAKPYLRLKDRVERLGEELFAGTGVEARVTSEMCLLHVAMDRIVADLSRSIAWAFCLVAVLMTLSLRSVRLGLLAVIPNVVPLLATLGFMGLTGIALRVGTVVVFSLGFGIAVDDTIHYLLVYRRSRSRSDSYRDAVIHTHTAVGKPIVLTSLVLIAGFLAASPATFKSISHMGILNSFTMAVALGADLFVTPLLVRLIEPSTAKKSTRRAIGMVDETVGTTPHKEGA